MAIDLSALKAKLAAQKAAVVSTPQSISIPPKEVANETDTSAAANSTTVSVVPTNSTLPQSSSESSSASVIPATDLVPTLSAPSTLGTAKTTEIDYLNFISKMNALAEAIHHQHPTMPVLLRQIHTQLRADPELVTTLDDDGIGIIVRGLQVQTKTELVSEVVKKTSSGRAKKVPALTLDML